MVRLLCRSVHISRAMVENLSFSLISLPPYLLSPTSPPGLSSTPPDYLPPSSAPRDVVRRPRAGFALAWQYHSPGCGDDAHWAVSQMQGLLAAGHGDCRGGPRAAREHCQQVYVRRATSQPACRGKAEQLFGEMRMWLLGGGLVWPSYPWPSLWPLLRLLRRSGSTLSLRHIVTGLGGCCRGWPQHGLLAQGLLRLAASAGRHAPLSGMAVPRSSHGERGAEGGWAGKARAELSHFGHCFFFQDRGLSAALVLKVHAQRSKLLKSESGAV